MDEFINILTEEEFERKYKPIKNELTPNASFNGRMFETYGKELSYVEQFISDNKVVTILDCNPDDDCLFLAAGFHYNNRVGFFILEIPYEEYFEVKLND